MADRQAAVDWIDSHCHLPTDEETLVSVLAEAVGAGVVGVVTVGCDAPTSEACVAAVGSGAAVGVSVWATAGIHPHDARTAIDPASGAVDLTAIEALLDRPGVVAVGECGLDYHYDHSPRDQQREAFAAQVALAHEHDLALVIHTREAWDDTFAVLDAAGVPDRTVLHCFTGGPDEARKCLDRGLFLSFSGIVTFKAADDVRGAAALCPLDRVLVETDSPYLAPAPHRGRPNRPALVPLVGAAVAQQMGVDVAAVAEATWANAERAYRLASPA